MVPVPERLGVPLVEDDEDDYRITRDRLWDESALAAVRAGPSVN
jgi:hypothetical protein